MGVTTLLLVAGESSGDLHGSNLARALRGIDPSIRILGAGGVHMRRAGVEILADPTGHASVGPVEALRNLHLYARLYRRLQSALRTARPDGVVLIDCPDFNLRFAQRATDHGVPVIYYIGPQLWAWRSGRIKAIRRLVRKMIVILDFEEKIYRDAGVDVAFVGHPLLDALQAVDRETFRRRRGEPRTLVGLLPGSRPQQVRALLPVMARAAELIGRDLPGTGFVVAAAPAIPPELVRGRGLDVVWDQTPEVMASCDLLITASGTATLEAALYGTPMIVTYKMNPLVAYTLGLLVRMNLRDFSLVNIVAGRRVMPEYYQARARPELLAREALSILKDGRLPEMRQALAEVRCKLGSPGASHRAAREVLRAIGRAGPLGEGSP